MKLSLFTWQWIFLRDHFFNDTNNESGLVFLKWMIPRPSPVSFFLVNDTDTESGLVFLKLTIPRPSPVSIFLSERYRYRVRSRFFKVNDTGTETWSRTPKSTRLQRDETETRSLGVPCYTLFLYIKILKNTLNTCFTIQKVSTGRNHFWIR